GSANQFTPSKPAALTAWIFFSSDHSASAGGCSMSVHRLAMKMMRGEKTLVMVGLEFRLQAGTAQHANRLKAELRTRGQAVRAPSFRNRFVFQHARADVLLVVEPRHV